MPRFDRLTTLMERFQLTVRPAPLGQATLVVTTDQDGKPQQVCFGAIPDALISAPDRILFAARVDWGGMSNPLVAALPAQVTFDLAGDADSSGVDHANAIGTGRPTLWRRFGD